MLGFYAPVSPIMRLTRSFDLLPHSLVPPMACSHFDSNAVILT